MTLELLAFNAGLVMALMTVLWGVSFFLKDVSIVDPWWSIHFLLVTVSAAVQTGWSPAKVLLVGAVALWAVRLWFHLFRRSLGQPEDPRYAAFRRRFGPERYRWLSFFQVFMLQGALALAVSIPLQVAAAAPLPDAVTPWHVAGVLVFAAGFCFEAVADAQLTAFRADPARRGTVLDTGLWRYSRHPNYFGEAVLGWGFWLCALPQPYGAWSALAPALMTFLLLRVSGVAMLDKLLASTKPGYAEYMRRTSAFIPRPPR